MRLVDDPGWSGWSCPQAECARGEGLDGEPVAAQRRHQVTDIEARTAPKVTEYVAQAKQCPCCGTVTEGELPAHGAGRGPASGRRPARRPRTWSPGIFLPVYRATLLLCRLGPAGLGGVDGRDPGEGRRADRGAAGSWSGCGSCCGPRRRCMRTRLRARTGGGMAYVHLACTTYLAHMPHRGPVPRRAIDAGGVLPGYSRGDRPRTATTPGTGTSPIALHAWCGAHLLRT